MERLECGQVIKRIIKYSKANFKTKKQMKLGLLAEIYVDNLILSHTRAMKLCKAKTQYLFTCKVSRYCLLAPHRSIKHHWKTAHLNGIFSGDIILAGEEIFHAN